MKASLINKIEVYFYLASLLMVLLENIIPQRYCIVVRVIAVIFMSISNTLTICFLNDVSPRQYVGTKVALVFNAICLFLIRTKYIPVPIFVVLLGSLGVIICVVVEIRRRTINSALFYNKLIGLQIVLLLVSTLSTILSYI